MNIMKGKKEIKKKLMIVMLLPLLTSCATYNSGFSCGDARGVSCTSMEKVDQLISSGEIETFVTKKKNCRGRACSAAENKDNLRAVLSGGKSTK